MRQRFNWKCALLSLTPSHTWLVAKRQIISEARQLLRSSCQQFWVSRQEFFPWARWEQRICFSKMHPIIVAVKVTHYFLTLSLANSTFDQLKIWPLLFHEADEIFTTSRSRNVKLQSNNPKWNLASLLCLKLLFLYEFKHQRLNIVYVWVTKFS